MIAFGAGALLGSLLSPTEPERRAAREVQPALESAASEAGGQAQQIDTTVCNLDGAQAFAEIVIVEEFRRNGWDAVWMDRKRYWSAMYEFVDDIRVEQREFVADLLSRAGSRGATWDVLAWREGSTRFAEAKRRQRDSIRESQRAFLEAALDAGVALGSFMVVGWAFPLISNACHRLPSEPVPRLEHSPSPRQPVLGGPPRSRVAQPARAHNSQPAPT